MTETASVVVDRPGVYSDMPDDVYHGDPVPAGSLSYSGARKLLPPSCPALYKHWAAGGRPPNRQFDLGHAAHRLVLGVGQDLVPIPADNYQTKAARESRDAAYADGKTPLLPAEHQLVTAIAEAVLSHPVAGVLFQPGTGQPEQSMFWVDDELGVWRRARLDWLRYRGAGRLIVPDLKTTMSAEPGHLSRAMHQFGYYQQAAWYLDGVRALGLDGGEPPAFVFVFVEKTPPYLVTVCEPDPEALHWGGVLNRRAVDLYRRCRATDTWPGYADRVIPVGLPRWAAYQHEIAADSGEYDIASEAAA